MALGEADRVVRRGGCVYAAAISRWSPRLHGVLVERVHHRYPVLLEMIGGMERTGYMPPLYPSSFTGYAHTPSQLVEEIELAGLTLESLVTLEGISFALFDLDSRLEDPNGRAMLLEVLRTVESVPELVGLGPHLLASARKV